MDLSELYQAYDALIVTACIGSIIATIIIMAVLTFVYYGRRGREEE